jgi:tellurite resistance protein TerC
VTGEVSALGWVLSSVALAALLAFDLLVVSRRRDAVTPGGAAKAVAFYVVLALAAAAIMFVTIGHELADQFLAVYATEYSLSADNLFVFMLIIARYAVPETAVEQVLSIGILLSLVMRAAFIAAGSAAVHAFSWVFYAFGAFLVYTAVRLFRSARGEEDEAEKPPGIVLLSRLIRPPTGTTAAASPPG